MVREDTRRRPLMQVLKLSSAARNARQIHVAVDQRQRWLSPSRAMCLPPCPNFFLPLPFFFFLFFYFYFSLFSSFPSLRRQWALGRILVSQVLQMSGSPHHSTQLHSPHPPTWRARLEINGVTRAMRTMLLRRFLGLLGRALVHTTTMSPP